jgi:ethanolamine utilization microcompartment shell protein EutL
MKKVKLISVSIAVLAIVSVTAFNVNLNSQSKNLSALSLANIEILAYGEPTNGTTHSLSCGSAGIKMCEGTCGIHQVTLKNYGDGKSSTFKCGN